MYDNLFKANEYLLQEAIVIKHLKCDLYNEDLQVESITENGVSFSIYPSDTEISITIHSPLSETLVVEIRNNNIFDYSCNR